MIGLLKKPAFWLALVILIIIALLVLILQSNSSKNLQSFPSKVSEKSKSGPKSGTCLILEQEFCSQAELIDWQAPWGTTYKAVGIRLPAGTAVFASLDGDLGVATEGSAFGRGVTEISVASRPDGTSFSASGALRSDLSSGATVNKGEPLAFIENRNVGLPNGYNLVILFFKPDANRQQVTNEEMLFTLFPDLKTQ